MKQLRSSRHLIKMWHRREKAIIAGAARAVAGEPISAANVKHSAFTPSGLSVEAQVRKAWQPCSAGLAMF